MRFCQWFVLGLLVTTASPISAKTLMAFDSMRSTITLRPSASVANWVHKSQANLEEGNWLEAIRTASAAIKLDPNYVVPYIVRAVALVKYNYKNKAKSDIDQVLRMAPKNPYALNIKGYLLQQSNANEQAQSLYEQACMLKLEMACKNFEEIAGFRPENPLSRIRYLLGMTEQAFEQKQWGKIVDYSNQILEQAPDNAKAYSNRAGAYAELGFLYKALADANKAIDLDPDMAEAYNNRGYAYQLMGNTHNAALEYAISCNMGVRVSCQEVDKLNRLASR